MKSLRARLLIAVGGATLVLWMGSTAMAYRSAHHEATELLDAQLAQSAQLLLQRIEHKDEQGDDSESEEDFREEHDHGHATPSPYVQDEAYAVWRMSGRLLLHSRNAPSLTRQIAPGYSEHNEGGQTWRVLSVRDPRGRYKVQVAQLTQARDQAALDVAWRVAVPMAVALPLLLGIIYIGVRRGLTPLDTLASEVARRRPDDLAELDAGDAPTEALPLVTALNDLLTRMSRTLDNERRFTADAAHELRTPLAALKVQAQVAGLANDKATRMHAIEQVLNGADRATRLVEQLLRLARLDPLRGPAEVHDCPPDTLIQGAVAALAQAAADKNVALISVEPEPDGQISGDLDMLALALRNLVENAVRYTPADGQVEVGANRVENGSELWVRDTGPGVDPADLARLTERFYRGREVSIEGSGLGLAIVQRIAQLHGGELRLENRPQGGFSATLCLK